MKYVDDGPPSRVQYVPKRAKKRVFRASSDVAGGPLSLYLIKFVLENVYWLPDNTVSNILNKFIH